jgi:hypothetical protein
MPQGTVPNSVPTPCIEALLTLASAVVPGWRKSLEASAIGEPRASLVPMANLLIMRGFTDREQGIGGSNPLARTKFPSDSRTSPGSSLPPSILVS